MYVRVAMYVCVVLCVYVYGRLYYVCMYEVLWCTRRKKLKPKRKNKASASQLRLALTIRLLIT